MTAKITRAQARLNNLEKEIKGRGVRLAYERLQFAGLRLKSGLCWFRGDYFLFVDRFKTVPERIDLIESALEELRQLEEKGALGDPVALAEMAEGQPPPEGATPAEKPAPSPAGQEAQANSAGPGQTEDPASGGEKP